MKNINEQQEKNLKVVINPAIASRLCDMGFPIVKIKRKRNTESDKYKCDTVFLFEKTEEFLTEFYKMVDKDMDSPF